jgi:hypothetical protein
MQCACAILSTVARPAQQYFATLSLKRQDFRKRVIVHKNVFWFSLQLLSETFLILRRYDHKPILVFVWSTRYSCWILMELNFWWIFEKYTYTKFHVNPSSGSRIVPCGQTDGWTDMTNLIVAFCNSANAPKYVIYFLYTIQSLRHKLVWMSKDKQCNVSSAPQNSHWKLWYSEM